MPKHFQKPINKDDRIIDILEKLNLTRTGEMDFKILSAGLSKMNRNEVEILYNQLWTITK